MNSSLAVSIGDAILFLAICFGIGGCYYIQGRSDAKLVQAQTEYVLATRGTNNVVENTNTVVEAKE